ncbi:MAG: hypothetical protein R3A10_14950 [Caldilineaceae bacterium]
MALANRDEIEYDCAVLRACTKGASAATLDARWRAAADRYHGDFLETVVLDEYPALDEWACAVRVELEIAAVRVLSTLTARCLDTGGAKRQSLCRAIGHTGPLRRRRGRTVCTHLGRERRRGLLLLYFQEYRRRLHEDMSVDVTRPSLLQLVAQINRPHVVRETLPDLRTPPATTGPRADRLVDRQIVRRTANARLEQLLDRGDRLISVTGMGGIGKTAFVRNLTTTCPRLAVPGGYRRLSGHRVNARHGRGHAPPHHCRRSTLTACGRHGCI